MPAFDLRHVQVAKYNYSNSAVSYTNKTSAGEAMTAQLELRFAEGSLYADGRLAEYIRQAVGGSISLGVKYLPTAAQTLMYGASATTRSVGASPSTASVAGLVYGAYDEPGYVGVSFYAPDMVDGAEKYTCVFVRKALFGPPSLNYQTKGENISFQTPTTTGQFLAEDGSSGAMLEVAVADSKAAAEAWCDAVLGGS